MSSVLNMPKSFDDVAQPEPMPEDWYTMRLMKDPEVLPNAVLKKYMADTGTKSAEEALESAIRANYQGEDGKTPGLNWVLSLRTVHDMAELSGRSFRRYLPLPNALDKERYTANGQTFEDWKMENILGEVEAFTGAPPAGDQVTLEAGQVAMYYVKVRYNEQRGRNENEIDINMAPRNAG